MYLLLDSYRQRQHMFFLIQEKRGEDYSVECWTHEGNYRYQRAWFKRIKGHVHAEQLFNVWRPK